MKNLIELLDYCIDKGYIIAKPKELLSQYYELKTKTNKKAQKL